MKPQVKGYLLGTIAAATYGMNPLFALPLYKTGMDPDSVLFFRYLFALPILGAMIKLRGRNFRLQRREILPLVILGLLLALSSLTLFQSYNYMDAGIASTILFVYPIMVAVIMAVVFKEKLKLWTAPLHPAGSGRNRPAVPGRRRCNPQPGRHAAGLGVGPFVCHLYRGGQPVGTQKRGNAQGDLLRPAVRSLALSDPARFRTRHLPAGSVVSVGANLLALAIFPTAIRSFAPRGPFSTSGRPPTAILGALEPVTAVFFGVTVFGEELTLRILCGILMIVAAVTFIVAGGSITTYLIRFRKLFPRLTPRFHLPRKR